MTEFVHNEVLFAGDDGLPIQFNIQNAVEKESLKALIEHGGGICTLSDEAIYLVSPGTKVMSILSSQKLISSRYVFDCVKENCLLDSEGYEIQINEMETSDISDSSPNLCENLPNLDSCEKFPDDVADNSIDVIQTNKVSNILNGQNSNHAFDFQDSESRNVIISQKKNEHVRNLIPLQSSDTHIKFGVHVEQERLLKTSVPDSLNFQHSESIQQNLVANEFCNVEANPPVYKDIVIENPIVSSSQENVGVLDQFDHMILNKIPEKPVQNDDSLSQSYTVSSSADAQVSPKPPSHHTSAEIFIGSPTAPDSASQTTERQEYIKNLEKEVEEILKKPSPKSTEDKTILVKYICIAKKLEPAIVLQILQKF